MKRNKFLSLTLALTMVFTSCITTSVVTPSYAATKPAPKKETPPKKENAPKKEAAPKEKIVVNDKNGSFTGEKTTSNQQVRFDGDYGVSKDGTKIVLEVKKIGGNGTVYTGTDAASRTNGYQMGEKDLYEAAAKAGVNPAQLDKYLADKGYAQNGKDQWKNASGQSLAVLDLKDLKYPNPTKSKDPIPKGDPVIIKDGGSKKLPIYPGKELKPSTPEWNWDNIKPGWNPDPAPSNKSNSSEPSTPSNSDPDNGYYGPADNGGDGGGGGGYTPPPPQIFTETKTTSNTVEIGRKWRLVDVFLTNASEIPSVGNIERVKGSLVNTINGSNSEYSAPTNPQTLYESNGSGFSKNWSSPEWTKLNAKYAAIWMESRKYNVVTTVTTITKTLSYDNNGQAYLDQTSSSSDVVTGPFYEVSNNQRQEVTIDYLANKLLPQGENMTPVDLTTEAGYVGIVINPRTHYTISSNLKSLSGTVPIKVSKTNLAASEKIKLMDTLKPASFKVNFKDTWFGLPRSANLTGGTKFNGDVGDQFVSWAEMWYGSDYLSAKRSAQVSTINKIGTDSSDENTQALNVRTSNDDYANRDYTFYLRSSKTTQGTSYKLGETENESWSTYYEVNRNNLRGVDWRASVTETPGSLSGSVTNKDYTRYVIYDVFMQPILVGDYDVVTVGGNKK